MTDKQKAKAYSIEARKNGYTCREKMVAALLSIPSYKWDRQYSDAEISAAQRIMWEEAATPSDNN